MKYKMKTESGKWKFIVLIFFLFPLSSFYRAQAQDTAKVTLKAYGFVRNYLTFDSRKTYTVIGGEYNMIPYDERWNENHSEGGVPAASWRVTLAASAPITPSFVCVWPT